MKRIFTPKEHKCKEFCLPTRLGGMIFFTTLEFGKEFRHLPAGFYLGYLRGKSFPPPQKKYLTSTPSPQKSIVIITVDISNYIGKII